MGDVGPGTTRPPSPRISFGRTSAGLSLRFVAEAAGIDHGGLWRYERGNATELTHADLAAVGAVVGQDVRLRAFPAGDPIRDVGQQRLLERLRACLHPSLTWRTEVPLQLTGDLRAWDAEIRGRTWRMPTDAETFLGDVQVVERRVNTKRRDDGAEFFLLLLADTRRNRQAVAAAPAAFADLRRDARGTLAALRAGERPPASALLLL